MTWQTPKKHHCKTKKIHPGQLFQKRIAKPRGRERENREKAVKAEKNMKRLTNIMKESSKINSPFWRIRKIFNKTRISKEYLDS